VADCSGEDRRTGAALRHTQNEPSQRDTTILIHSQNAPWRDPNEDTAEKTKGQGRLDDGVIKARPAIGRIIVGENTLRLMHQTITMDAPVASQ